MKTTLQTLALLSLSFLAPACGGGGKKGPQGPVGSQAAKTIEVSGLMTPESAMYLADEDVYLVSNINGDPFTADDNGFISKVGPDGKIVNLKWIDGSTDAVTLNAPKGMAVRGGKLYVADIDHVAVFDLATGAPAGSIAVEGATFLNDVAAEGDMLVVSDSGFGKDFKSTGTEAIWSIGTDDSLSKLASGVELAGPNGVAIHGGEVWVAPFGAKKIYRIGDSKEPEEIAVPGGQLDGLVMLDDGSIYVSSWEAKSVFARKQSATFIPIVKDVTSPADIGIDTKRSRVLIPDLMKNRLLIAPL